MKNCLLLLLVLCTLPLQARESTPDGGSFAPPSKKNGRSGGQHLDVHLGETVSATIALGQINRIVLPFDRPEIRTLNPSTAEIQGHVLYIAPVDPGKIYLYVTNADDPDGAIALSLSPQEIPPRELSLDLVSDPVTPEPKISPGRSEAPEMSAEAASLQDPTRQLLKTLAMGQIPEGYRLRSPGAHDSIHCKQKHLLIQTRQVFEGSGHQIRVGVLRNNGKSALTLDEESCTGSAPIQAIATYPSGGIDPGHEAEIFVVIRPEPQVAARHRPILIAKRP
jgi:conjugal transfer pilus assembly protein TraK